MWSYVTAELPALIAAAFPADMARQSIMGHSMGGQGALTIGLTFPDRYRAVSAFAPIVAPAPLPWGEKALGGYLGANRAAWRAHDAVRGRAVSSVPRSCDTGRQEDCDGRLTEECRHGGQNARA